MSAAHWYIIKIEDYVGAPWVAEHHDGPATSDGCGHKQHEYGNFETYEQALAAVVEWSAEECKGVER